MATSITCFLLLLCASSAFGYKSYQALIPNGDRVQHPCYANKQWSGVGHFQRSGGGPQNPFGADFKKAGMVWTKELCMKDSDGDGRSNGDELGDPSCVWSKGQTPARVVDVSHPGVCQPLTSENCKKLNGAWDICVPDTLVCPAINNEKVSNFTLKFTKTKIPSKVTNYFCQAFALPPTANNSHLIAYEPVINNTEVMHHALVFGCKTPPNAALFTTPRECGMGGTSCNDLIGIWSLGGAGMCLPEQFGILFGSAGYSHIVIQFHWNNINQRSDLYDESAIRFYVTTALRPNHGAIMMAGQRYLELPPGKESVTQEATCTSDCTSLLATPINVTDVFPHMHYAGKFAEAYQYRNGKKIRDLLQYTAVVYDSPLQRRFPQPIDFLPGDEIKMKCHYKTTHLKETMYYGDSTQDEMCFLFLSFYPAKSFPMCLNYGPVDMCGINLPKNGGKHDLPGNIGDCNVADFFIQSLPTKWNPLLNEFCDYSLPVCRSGCMNVLKKMMAEEPCWKGWAKKYIEFSALFSPDLRKMRLQVASCEAELLRLSATEKPPMTPKPPKLELMELILIAVGSAVVLLLVVVVAAIGILKATGGIGKKAKMLPLQESDAGADNNAYTYDPNNTKF